MDATAMSNKAATQFIRKRAAARLRAIRRRASCWQRGARKVITLALVAACAVESPSRSFAQIGGAFGQGAMAPAGGIVNGAVARFKDLEANGPGWMYYGVNAADRGLGYRGSYMTLGGFIPYAEDDLGGLWSADLRGHLSNYGGFFSNVGFVRKQFIGGALGGIGVYWDYDGDQNQYSNTVITDRSGSYTFAGGQTYQQVGVSGEFLTDWGNLRSNGYIPCGTTAQTMGPLVGNSLLCQTGINAALAGADLEVGAYIPGLSDWAGMVSVGGYAFGNSRYNLVGGQDVVPWFGGVYTRLDMTFIKNWDFSLQANNDSYFDWTGFARLTYRMGGSRRRTVSDQVEQPMMRNEHIVRAHQAPEQALIPYTAASIAAGVAGTPFVVYSVDNSSTDKPGGTGTYENPFHTLQQAQVAAMKAYDIVFVRVGQSAACPYETPVGGYQFQANNQYLVGEGTSLKLCTANCGDISLWSTSTASVYPVIQNPTGPAVVLNQNGVLVDHVKITGSPVGITDGPGMPAGGVGNVNDVQIVGNGAGQRGVEIQDLAGKNGTFNFTNMNLQNLTRDGIVVSAAGGGNPVVNISASTINNTTGSGIVVQSDIDTGRVRVTDTTVTNSTQAGVFVGEANVYVGTSKFEANGLAGVYVQDKDPNRATSGTSTVQVANSSFTGGSVGIWAMADQGTTNFTATGNTISTTSAPIGGNGIIMSLEQSTGGVLNASLIGNRITPPITTTGSSTLTTGTIPPGVPIIGTNTTVGNILLTTTTGTAGGGTLNIKASDLVQLQSMNNNAGVATVPMPTVSGSTVLVPPPPVYNAALIVPLPPP